MLGRFRIGRRADLVVLFLSLTLSFSCSPIKKEPQHSPEELRKSLLRRIGSFAAGKLVVPFEVDPEHIQKARQLTQRDDTLFARAETLASALFAEDAFGLKYSKITTKTAKETLRTGRGNCLSLASVYVGLARGLGLRAHYLDASEYFSDVQQRGDIVVKSGHVTAAVDTGARLVALEFGHQLRLLRTFRLMSDLEAVAHYYNNRGYELIHNARRARRPVNWRDVARNFAKATRVKDDFAQAWNNLGVAFSRLGRTDEAMVSYQMAIKHEPELSSPYTNLGVMLLHQGAAKEALQYLRRAVELDPKNANVQYHLGRALRRLGRDNEAMWFLRQTRNFFTTPLAKPQPIVM